MPVQTLAATTSLADMIRNSAWAGGLRPDELERVLGVARERHLASGDYVCRGGARAEHWIGVIEGMVKLSSLSVQGQTVTFTEVTAAGWFGEGSVLKDEARKYDGIALCETRIALIPRKTFHELLDSSIAFNRFLLNQLNERLATMISMLEYDRLLSTDARVARCLSTLFNVQLYPGDHATLQLSQEEIAHLCGLSRQRVNRALRTLERARIVKADYGRITVLDLAALRNYGA